MRRFRKDADLAGADENCGNVVVAACVVGGFDKLAAAFIDGFGSRQNARHGFFGDLTRKSVGAEEKNVPGFERKLRDFRLYRLLSADGAGDYVSERRAVRVLLRHVTKAHLFVDERMIVGLTGEPACTEEITAAVAYVTDERVMVLNRYRNEGCAHTLKTRILSGLRVDQTVGVSDGFLESYSAVIGCVYSAQTFDESVDGEPACDFAGGCSAHAVADGENAGFETVTVRVFIRGSYSAGVSERGSLKSDG